MFSRNGDKVDAYDQLLSAWCSEDRMRAIESLFDGDLNDEKDEVLSTLSIKIMNSPVDYQLRAHLLFFLEDGRVIPGYQNYKNILEIINQ